MYALEIAINNNATMSEEVPSLSRQMSVETNDTEFGEKSTQELGAALEELVKEFKVADDDEHLSTMRDKMNNAVEQGREHDVDVAALR